MAMASSAGLPPPQSSEMGTEAGIPSWHVEAGLLPCHSRSKCSCRVTAFKPAPGLQRLKTLDAVSDGNYESQQRKCVNKNHYDRSV